MRSIYGLEVCNVDGLKCSVTCLLSLSSRGAGRVDSISFGHLRSTLPGCLRGVSATRRLCGTRLRFRHNLGSCLSGGAPRHLPIVYSRFGRRCRGELERGGGLVAHALRNLSSSGINGLDSVGGRTLPSRDYACSVMTVFGDISVGMLFGGLAVLDGSSLRAFGRFVHIHGVSKYDRVGGRSVNSLGLLGRGVSTVLPARVFMEGRTFCEVSGSLGRSVGELAESWRCFGQ